MDKSKVPHFLWLTVYNIRVCSENSDTPEEAWLCDPACLAGARPRNDDLQPFRQSHGIHSVSV